MEFTEEEKSMDNEFSQLLEDVHQNFKEFEEGTGFVFTPGSVNIL